MAEFGLQYYAEMRSKHHNILWRVEIAERSYAGSSEEMTFAGDEPIIIIWEARGDEFYAPVKASEATINILCKDNFHYLSLFTSDVRQFRVSIFRSGALYWRSFVTADLCSETFTAPPYTVTIKAVDGFNLLESYIFKDLMSIGTSGRLSLWNLTTRCLDLLELDMEVSDWLDLYGEGMNEGISPLRQTFIDLERLYYVYEEPTYRDILELCLLPFAGQIFQSSGALHIRRAISLYQSSRPVTFFEIGSEFPVGEVMTDDAGTHLIAEEGVNVVTSSGRDVVDDMWNAGIYVMGEATLDIVPALRSVTVDVKNKSIENLADHLGFFSPEAWDDPNTFIDFGEWGDSLCFCGSKQPSTPRARRWRSVTSRYNGSFHYKPHIGSGHQIAIPISQRTTQSMYTMAFVSLLQALPTTLQTLAIGRRQKPASYRRLRRERPKASR